MNDAQQTITDTSSSDAKLTALLALQMRAQAASLFESNKALQIGFLAECGLSDEVIALIMGTNKNNVRVGRQTYKKIQKKK